MLTLYDKKYYYDSRYYSVEAKACRLGYIRTVGEYEPVPIDTIKRKVPFNSSTFTPDPRNKAGVGNLHRSRISVRVVPIDARYCEPSGEFAQEW
jgi:hypothetical protein